MFKANKLGNTVSFLHQLADFPKYLQENIVRGSKREQTPCAHRQSPADPAGAERPQGPPSARTGVRCFHVPSGQANAGRSFLFLLEVLSPFDSLARCKPLCFLQLTKNNYQKSQVLTGLNSQQTQAQGNRHLSIN